MADFAQLIYGTAQNAAQNQGAGLAEAISTGAQLGLKQQQLEQDKLTQAATLAMKQEELQQQKAQLAQKNKENAEAKLTNLYDYMDKVRNYDSASDRNGFLKWVASRRDTLGIDKNAVPDEMIFALKSDENLGRYQTIADDVRAGRLTKAEAMRIITDPEALAKVVPMPLDLVNRPDLSKAEKDFLDRQSQERQAAMKVGQQGITNTVELRKELTAHPVSKDTFIIESAYNKIKNNLTGKPSAASDMSAVFAYMKLLDPASTVREGEQAQARDAAGVPERILSAYNRTVTGETLSPAQRKDFLAQAKKIYNTQATKQADVNKQYENIAKETGINPKQIIAGTDIKPDNGNARMIKLANGKQYSETTLQTILTKNPNHPLAAEIRKALERK